ncbi:testis-expressed protein 50-like [Tachyglossus aculeatus]|uniref:testis-expressed protein 50-like n=1 Tax=Tachyglossus aculeatus TaxID=9261 RepID=UPI0018F64DA2|nr:testis-expressed protein 50-like [Tachyglossus aculeatus]
MFLRALFWAILTWSSASAQRSLGCPDRERWTRVGWEILPEEMPQLKRPLHAPLYCLPNALDDSCLRISTYDLFRICMWFLCIVCTGLLFNVVSLALYHRWTEGKQRLEKPERVPSEIDDVLSVHQLLVKLLTTSEKILERVEEMAENLRVQKGRRSHADGGAEAEGKQEAFPAFPVYPTTPRTPPPSLASIFDDPSP